MLYNTFEEIEEVIQKIQLRRDELFEEERLLDESVDTSNEKNEKYLQISNELNSLTENVIRCVVNIHILNLRNSDQNDEIIRKKLDIYTEFFTIIEIDGFKKVIEEELIDYILGLYDKENMSFKDFNDVYLVLEVAKSKVNNDID